MTTRTKPMQGSTPTDAQQDVIARRLAGGVVLETRKLPMEDRPIMTRSNLDRVLIVEDDKDLREALAEVISARGIEVSQESNGEAGLAAIERRAFALVITDVRLPGTSGIQLARDLARIAPGTRLVLMTAYPEWMMDRLEPPLSSLCILLKPFDIEEFADFVENVLAGMRPAKG